MKYISAFFALLITGFNMCLSGQNAPISTIGNVTSTALTAKVPITAGNFTNIGACDMRIFYNPDIAYPTSVTIGSGLGGNIDANLKEPGVIRFGWYASPCVTLTGTPVIFNINFCKVSTGTTSLTFDYGGDNGYLCQFTCGSTEYNDDPNTTYYIDGSLTFGEVIVPVTTAPAITACPNTQISVPITVTDFKNIGAVNLNMAYNTSVLTFVTATNTGGFPGLTVNGNIAGTIIVGGNTAVEGGFTLGTSGSGTLYTLTFNYLGGTTNLSWNDNPEGNCEYAGPAPINFVFNDDPAGNYYIPGSVSPAANANAGNITGTSPLVPGTTATYSSNGDGGGTWSSSTPAVASVNPSSGLVTALTTGSTDITYTVNTGCNAPASAYLTLTVADALHYRTVGSGNWTNPANWERSITGADNYGVSAITYPTNSAQTIKVRNSHTITVNESVSVDQFTIEAGGEVTVPTGVTLTNAGAADQFVIKSTREQSGSLLTVGTGQVTNPVTYELRLRTDDWHYFSSPLGSLTSDPGNITQVYAWDEPSGNWTPFSGYNFTSGQGYNLDQIGSGVLSFTGSVVYSASVTATSPYTTNFNLGTLAEYNARIARTPFGAGGWNLLGNPFTSAMSVSGFLEANDGDGTVATNKFDPNYVAVYIYDGDLNQYFYRGKTTGFADPVTDEDPANAMFDYDNIQTGQGFFVLAQKNGVSFSFDRTMQTHSTSVPLKSATIENSWPGLKLKVKSGMNENSTLIVFNDRMTTGLDPGYDVGQLSAGPDVEIYTALVKDNGVNFSQQALPLAGNEKNIVSVGIDCEKGASVTFSAYLVPIGTGTFYLEDKVTGMYTDLSKESYSVTLPAKTSGTGRFFIHNSLVTGIAPALADPNKLNLRIWTSQNKLNIEGTVSSKATGALYDLLSRKIFETSLNNATLNTITVPAEITGIYLVKITDGNRVAVKKVVF